jgi:hypothetical protein
MKMKKLYQKLTKEKEIKRIEDGALMNIYKIKYTKSQEDQILKYRSALEQETPEIRKQKLSRFYHGCKNNSLKWNNDDWVFYLNYGQDSGYNYDELCEFHLNQEL